MKSRTILLLLVILSLCAVPLSPGLTAQSISSPYQFLESRQEVDIFAGHENMGTGRFGFGPGPGLALGARYGINLSGPFGLEGVVSYIPTTRDIIDPGRDEGDQVIGDMASDIVVIDGRLRFSLTGDRSWHGFAPFVLAGGGLAFDASSDKADLTLLLPNDIFEFGTSFVGVFGGGFRLFPGDRFVIRGDATFQIWQLDTPVGFLDTERAFEGAEEKEWVSGSTFSLGLGYRF